jgi:acyl-CoA carboxylase epsilon subunit
VAVHLRSINPDATPEEVAAIVAALTARRASPPEPAPSDTLQVWVRAARIRSRRAGLQRGPWRLSTRVGRRSAS